ncbi:isochorismatase family cysteine hydrolase [Mesobacillus subterraneus]|uniref:cysteine hydrolase family protein n=1 Tax=Mesobacillus subterraneus TaxID=285983 RepID=UPI001CFC9E5E|nr:isochorismatase family cysteine hydrolase [Mesobacillus subterraneus]WLR55120.1 isochorismatase family cysteine hydrolase [Mesobacillus subterraneus]
MSKAALLIIDMINDFNFDAGKTLAIHTRKIIDPILTLKRSFNKSDMPVIYINDHYNLWQADFEKIIDHCSNETSDELIKKIAPEKNQDYFLIKPKHSAFYGTALHTLLQQLKVDTLVLSGIAGNICVLFTANDAYMREYNLIIPEDFIASNDDEDNKYALTMMKNVLSADTRPSRELDF